MHILPKNSDTFSNVFAKVSGCKLRSLQLMPLQSGELKNKGPYHFALQCWALRECFCFTLLSEDQSNSHCTYSNF